MINETHRLMTSYDDRLRLEEMMNGLVPTLRPRFDDRWLAFRERCGVDATLTEDSCLPGTFMGF